MGSRGDAKNAKGGPNQMMPHALNQGQYPAAVAAGFEPFIDKTEVAKRLGRGVRTVEFWMHQGLLPYYKIKQSVSFRWSEVQQHLKESCRVCR